MDDLRPALQALEDAVAKLQSTVYKQFGDLHAQDFLLQSRIKELQEEIVKLKEALNE